MNSGCKQALAVFLNFAVLTHQLSAELQQITFDSMEWVPYQTVGDDASSGWQLVSGNAYVSPEGEGFGNTGKALKIPGTNQNETRLTRLIEWDPAEQTAFIDQQIRPSADPSGSLGTLYVNGTQIAFQVPEGSSTGEIWVYHGNDAAADPAAHPEQWFKTVGTFVVPDGATTSSGYLRITLRHDYQRNLWDLFIDGKLAAANLGFEGRSVSLQTIEFFGGLAGDTLIDDISALSSNMLFPDADKDGLSDEWEIANGSNPNVYDRDEIKPGTNSSFLDLYMNSLWESGSINGKSPAASSGGIPPLTILGSHQPVGSLKGSLSVGADGSANYSVPIDLPKGTAGMEPKLSLAYSSNGGNGLLGVGWNLNGLQRITRGAASHAKDGFTGAVRYDDADRFFFDGERLICVNGEYGAENSEYRTEIDSYARIILRGGNAQSAASWWEVQTKSGLTIELGTSPTAKILAPGPAAPLFWDVTKVSDTIGNYYSVSWSDSRAPDGKNVNDHHVAGISYTGNSGMAPFCHVEFLYENRPDASFAYHPSGLRSEVNQRLSGIAVKTGGTLNFTYRLSYDVSAQTGRSILKSLNKEMADGSRTNPTVFNWGGLAAGEPKWKKEGEASMPIYHGNSWDERSGAFNSMVSTQGSLIRLEGDVSRAVQLDPGVVVTQGSYLEFEIRGGGMDQGAGLAIDGDLSWSSSNNNQFFVWIKPPGASSNPVSYSRDVAYPNDGQWQLYRVPLQSSYTSSNLKSGTYGVLGLMNFDSNDFNGTGWAEFRNIRIGTEVQLSQYTEPIAFPEVNDLPRFTHGGSSRGMRIIDLDSDGLPDLTDSRTAGWKWVDGELMPDPTKRYGTVYRNNGRGLDACALMVPNGRYPLSEAGEDGGWAYRHDLVAVPCDVNSDGRLDLFVSEVRTGPSPDTSIKRYKFITWNGEQWIDLADYNLPFESRNNASPGGYGGHKHLVCKDLIDFDRDGYPDLLINTSGVGWLAMPNPAQSLPASAKILPEQSQTVYLNRVHLGQGWVRRDHLAPPLQTKRSDGSNLHDNGRAILDVDGDGFMDLVTSYELSATYSTWTLHRYAQKYWPASASGEDGTWIAPGSTALQSQDRTSLWLPNTLVWRGHGEANNLDDNASLFGGVNANELGEWGAKILDLNGDGLTDVLKAATRRYTAKLSRYVTKTCHEACHAAWFSSGRESVGTVASAWIKDPSPYGSGYTLPISLDTYSIDSQSGYELADFNGDGLVDILVSKDTNYFVGPNIIRAATANDPLKGTNNGGFINSGTGWIQDLSWGLPPGIRLGKSGRREPASAVADLNGDGFPDIIGKILDGQQPELWLNQCKPEVIRSIADGFGSELSIEYHRLNDSTPTPGFGTRVYEKHSGNLPQGQASIIDARLVVSRYSEPDGMGGRRYRSQRYGDLRYDRNNEASLGFGWIEALDELTGQVSRTETSREFPFAGSPVYSETKVNLTQAAIDAMPPVCASGGALAPGVKVLSTETASYAELPSTTGVGGTIRRPVQTGSVKRLFDLDGSLKSETVTTQALADFDEFGFVKCSTVQALDGSLVTTSNTYTHNTSGGKWHLGRLTGSTVTKSGGGKPSITKTSAFTYDASTGLLKTETIEPGHPLSVTTAYIHDAFGNVVGTTVTASGQSRTSQATYDPKGRFMVSESNQLGHTVTYSYDDSKSLLLSTTDINGKTTSFGYDQFGTQIYTRHPDGTESAEITGYANNGSVPATVAAALTNPIVYFRAKESSGSPVATVYLDAMGRELVAETTILRDATSSLHSKVYSVTRYDNQGRKIGVSDPFGATETPLFTTVAYDSLNRTTQTTHPDGTLDRVLVQGACSLNGQPMTYSKVVGRNGQTLERWEDQHGRLVQSSDPSNQVTTFNHDHEGRLLSVAIDGVTQLTNTFDLLGNKTQVSEINSGTSSSSYNGFGEAISVTNAKGQTTTTQYDVLGRPVSVTKPEGSYAFFYDGAPGAGIGQPWKTTGSDGYLETVAYDSLGRPISTSKTQFGETFTTSTRYDSLGRVATATDAGGLTVVHEYDALSFPVALRIGPGVEGAGTLLWKAGTFDAKGRALSQTLAQGVTTTASYHPTSGLLTAMSSVHSTGTLQGKSYVWDANGNLTSRVDMIAQREESFTYDSLNRVTGATVAALSGAINNSVPSPASYTYAANGNLLSKPGLSNVSYGGSRPHAVTSATIKGAARTYTYDAAGYVIDELFAVGGKRRTYTWASFGQLKSLDYLAAPGLLTFSGTMIYAASRVQSDFAFDAGGNRARQMKVRIATDDSRKLEETLYLGSYEREIHTTQASSGAPQDIVKTVHRHSLGGFAVYTRTQKPGLPDSVKLSTILKDHLGSTDVILAGTWNGSSFADYATEFQSFDPWGERRYANTFGGCRPSFIWPYRTSSMDYDRGYTSHEQLDDSGLIHMNGRIYDPELGRMLSPDPVVQVPEYSQNFNRYSYVMNNPLNMTDPTGFSWISKAFHKIGHWVKKNWRTVVSIAVGVVLFFALGPGAFGIAGMGLQGAQLGMAVGAAMGAFNAAINGGNFGDILKGAVVGGIQGAITGGLLHGMEGVAEASGFWLDKAAHIVGHGLVGGAANVAMGGKFQDGFLSAAAAAYAGWTVLKNTTIANSVGSTAVGRTTIAGIVGGTASALGGGKFANGTWTASFQHLLNNEMLDPNGGWSDNPPKAIPLDKQVLVFEPSGVVGYGKFDQPITGGMLYWLDAGGQILEIFDIRTGGLVIDANKPAGSDTQVRNGVYRVTTWQPTRPGKASFTDFDRKLSFSLNVDPLNWGGRKVWQTLIRIHPDGPIKNGICTQPGTAGCLGVTNVSNSHVRFYNRAADYFSNHNYINLHVLRR